eukprot:scaffold35260_cov272-Skeletonema_dohrnii-CCMP3373.AAC.2
MTYSAYATVINSVFSTLKAECVDENLISCNAAAQRWVSLKTRYRANKIISHRSLSNICQEDDVGTAAEAFVCDKNIVDTQASRKPGA